MIATDPPDSAQTLSFRMLGLRVQVDCAAASVARVVLANFEAMAVEPGIAGADLQYVAGGSGESGPFSLACRGQAAIAVPDIGQLLFQLEQDVAVALQQRRPDLLFLHAAALEHGGRAWLVAGDSGNGKSTTAWGLLHHGLRYLSDELSPIDPRSLRVLPYPHALCLKRRPPVEYPLPADVLDLGGTIHVPVRALPAQLAPRPCTPAAVLFVRYRAGLAVPALRALSPAEAGARLYAATLNALAHPGHGLDAVVQLAERVRCYSLDCGDLHATCERVCRLLAAPVHHSA